MEYELNFEALKNSIFAKIKLGDFLNLFGEKETFNLSGLFTGLGNLLASLF